MSFSVGVGGAQAQLQSEVMSQIRSEGQGEGVAPRLVANTQEAATKSGGERVKMSVKFS